MLNFAHYHKTTARLGYGQTAEMAGTQPVTATQITTVCAAAFAVRCLGRQLRPKFTQTLVPRCHLRDLFASSKTRSWRMRHDGLR